MSNVLHFIQAGGIVMIPLLLMSFIAVGIIVERWITYKEISNKSPHLVKRVLALCDGNRYEEAQQVCESHTGPVANCLAAILKTRHLGPENVERKVQEVGERQFRKLEKYLPFLETTATIAPLLGLLGTLFGMIGTFQAIATAKDQSTNDRVLAGVGEALYATATGLTVAVLCFVAYNFFMSRQRTIVAETDEASTTLINSLIAKNALEPVELEAPRVVAGGLGGGL